MKSLVTSKGQITIPKPLRDQFGIEVGTEISFDAAGDGIRLRKVVSRAKPSAALGCLKGELASRSVEQWIDELRGPVELPPRRRKGSRR